MSSSFDTKDGVKEVNAKLSAALAERAKQDALFSSAATPSAKQQQQPVQAIVVREAAPAANQKYSDIDLILAGDFQED